MTAMLCAVAAVLAWPGPPRWWSPVAARPSRLTVIRGSLLRSRGRSTRAATRALLLGTLQSIGPAVRAGVDPSVAVVAAVAGIVDDPAARPVRAELRELCAAAACGDDLADCWRRMADRTGLPALRVVASAWALTDRLGCGLADALRTATDGIRADQEAAARVRVVTAGPRATMQLLTLLPVAGIALSMPVGLNPLTLVSGPMLWLATLPGAALLLGGRALVRRMIRRATAPGTLG